MTTKACAVCNGTGLAYDRTEFRMVPCGGICCVVKGTDGVSEQSEYDTQGEDISVP